MKHVQKIWQNTNSVQKIMNQANIWTILCILKRLTSITNRERIEAEDFRAGTASILFFSEINSAETMQHRNGGKRCG
jgi:predicted oxidoreductase (fatty acid repression mutant protein)